LAGGGMTALPLEEQPAEEILHGNLGIEGYARPENQAASRECERDFGRDLMARIDP
jgi:hypothetical protein